MRIIPFLVLITLVGSIIVMLSRSHFTKRRATLGNATVIVLIPKNLDTLYHAGDTVHVTVDQDGDITITSCFAKSVKAVLK